jgi:ankyrin repeat protein
MLGELIKDITENNNEVIIKKVTQNKNLINEKSAGGNTLLIFAVYCDNVVLVEFLLKNGADKHLKNSHGESSVDIATNYKSKEIIELLEKY